MLRPAPSSTLFPYTTLFRSSMHKMFQYRIYPTKKQVQKLNETLDECRWLYNHFLRSEEHTSELQSHSDLVCRLLLEKKKKQIGRGHHRTTVTDVSCVRYTVL